MNPISMELDFEADVGRIEYRIDSFTRIQAIATGIIAEYDVEDRVLAIELRALDNDTLRVAGEFAVANGLAFPAFIESLQET